MRKMFWAAIVLGSILVVGAMVTAQETTTQPAPPHMQGMGSMMGMMAQGGQMGSMPMMQGMMRMIEACSQMMGTAPSTEQGSGK